MSIIEQTDSPRIRHHNKKSSLQNKQLNKQYSKNSSSLAYKTTYHQVSSSKKRNHPCIIFQCGNCHKILFTSEYLTQKIHIFDIVYYSPENSENLHENLKIVKDIQMATENEPDHFCVYYAINCKNCQKIIGKFYIATISDFDPIIKTISIYNVVAYDLTNSKLISTYYPSKPNKKSIDQNKDERNSSIGMKNKDYSENLTRVKSNQKKGKSNYRGKAKNPNINRISMFNEDNENFQSNEDDKQNDNNKTKRMKINNIQNDSDNDHSDSNKHDHNNTEIDNNIQQIIEIDNNFLEMKDILIDFTGMLKILDNRLSENEKKIDFLHNTLTSLYRDLNIPEIINMKD